LHPLDGPWLKIVRAGDHLEALKNAIADFETGEPIPYGHRREFKRERAEYDFHGLIDRDPPSDISLITGDFIHNVRAALDHVAWQLRIDPADSNPKDLTQFPIFDKSKDWNPKRRSMKHIRPDVLAYMEMLQPYDRMETREGRLLRLIRDLDLTDKHRTILLAGSFATLLQLNVPSRPGEIEYWRARAPKGMFEHDDVIATIPADADGQIQLEPEFVFHVALGEPGPYVGSPLFEVMLDLYRYARFDLVKGFSRFFPEADNPFLSDPSLGR
jgi:hypothetical protein